MTSGRAPQRRVSFGEFELDVSSGELHRGAERVVLPDQPLRILARLIREPGTLVTRDELRRELWANDTFVDFEHSLNAAIKRLREMVGDSATAPRFIETIPRRGYRFIAPVKEVNGRAAAAAAEAEAPRVPIVTSPRRRIRWAAALLLATVLVTILVWRWTTRDPVGRGSLLPVPVRITSTSGLTIDPALSPDGSLVAYASDRAGTGGLDIWVQHVAGGTPTRVTTDQGDEAEPSFSPDGATLVYAKRESGGIYAVEALGGEPRPLVEVARARTPRFSRDGRWVLYWTGMPVWSALEGATPLASGNLLVVPAGGGTPIHLARDFASARYGIWSPDGRRILFLGEKSRVGVVAAPDWYLTSLDGAAPVATGAADILRRAGLPGVPIPGHWEADGGAVIFASAGEGASAIWQLPISPATGQVSGSPEPLTFGTAIERSPSVSRSRRIAFASVIENVDVWRIPLDPVTGVARGAPERITDDAAHDRVMNVSDDGKTLAFNSTRAGQDDVWIRDLESGRERQLSHTGAFAARMRPDGAVVAVNRDMPAMAVDLAPVSGAVVSPLCSDCEVNDWSTGGSRMLIRRGFPARLLIRDVASGRESELASHPTWNLFQGRLSPDGRWVVFQTTNSPTLRQIYVVPASAERPVPFESWVPIVTDFGIQPSWAPDGRGVYHFSFRDGAFCAWLQPIDPHTARPSGPPRAVQHLHQPRLRAVVGAIVTNDVRAGYLYATLTESAGNIWLLDAPRTAQPESATWAR